MVSRSLLLALAFSLLLLGCVQQPSTSAPTPAPTASIAATPTVAATPTPRIDVVEIRIRDFRFNPQVARLPLGAKVKWINDGEVPHTVYITPLNTESKVLNKGDSYEITLDKEIVYDYLCGIHPFMKAKIFVGAAVEKNKALEPEGPAPVISSVEPNIVPADKEILIAIKGKNFREGATAFFHHLFGNVTFVDSTMLHVITPKHYANKTGVLITNPDGQIANYSNFTFVGGEATPTPPTASLELGQEIRTIHFVSSTPAHGVTLQQAPAMVAVDFNYRIVQGSYIRISDASRVVAEGAPSTSSNLRLEVVPPVLASGVYKVEYHAIWPGGSYHDGQFYFKIS